MSDVALDIFDAADKITSALSTFPDDHAKKAILMALVALDKVGLVVDPDEFKAIDKVLHLPDLRTCADEEMSDE